jgi:hypothetical protein
MPYMFWFYGPALAGYVWLDIVTGFMSAAATTYYAYDPRDTSNVIRNVPDGISDLVNLDGSGVL